VRTNLSSSLTVGGFRYVQHAVEEGVNKNPDHLVQHFLGPEAIEMAQRFLQKHGRAGLNAHPFYNYLLVRTIHYDQAFLRAVRRGCKQIVIFGAGTDTRAYRFRELLLENSVVVIEADQGASILEKEKDARRLGDCGHVRFMPLDFGTARPEVWVREAGYDSAAPTLLLLEGVTPYLVEATVRTWFDCLSRSASATLDLTCDYKFVGRDDAFGQTEESRTLRLPDDDGSIWRFHEQLGFETLEVLRSADLARIHRRDITDCRTLSTDDVIVSSRALPRRENRAV
jgi:methyltransferase (TIGR00027 family)